MPAAGTFTVVMDPEEVIGGEGESGRLTVRFQGGSDYALFGGDELRVVDKFARTGNQATAVQSGYELELPTDVPSDGLAADSTVGYDLVWFTKDARVPALFTAQPANSTVYLADLVNQEPGIPLEVSAGYAAEAQMWAGLAEEMQDAAVTTLLNDDASGPYAAVLAGFAPGLVATHPQFGGSLQAFFNAVKARGGTGIIPEGTYNQTATLTVGSGTKPFQILGSGPGTIIKRNADYGSVVAFTSTDGFTFGNLTIDGGFTTYATNANHGLTVLDCSDVHLRDITVTNYKNSAIIAYATTAGTDTGVVIENCHAAGNGATTNNGILLSYLSESFIRNSTARDIMGTPGIGIQLKNTCTNSGMVDVQAYNCGEGIQIGGDTPGAGPRQCNLSGLTAIDCNSGFVSGDSYDTVATGVLVDMKSKATGMYGMRLQSDSNGITVTGVQLLNITNAATPLRLDGVDCTVEVDRLVDNTTSGTGVQFGSTSTGNLARLKRVKRGGTEVVDTFFLSADFSTTLTNGIDMAGGQNSNRYTIASDAITIRNRKAAAVLLSTEGGAGTDTLATINGGMEGQQIVVSTRLNSQDVTVVQTGNISLAGSDMTLDNSNDALVLIYRGTAAKWCEVSRANNGA